MTDEQIKEELSRSFVSIIGSTSGFTLTVPGRDHGVDLLANKVLCRTENGQKRYFDDSQILRFQLKATCRKEIVWGTGSIKYDLKSRNYNDLVNYRPGDCASPLTLILCILPDDKRAWMTMKSNFLAMFAEAFYYQADKCSVMIPSENSTKRIEIPLSNRINANFINELYEVTFK